MEMECATRNHFSHQHTLRRAHSKLGFKCGGCHQDGIGFHFNCHSCGYNLHTQCAGTDLADGVHTDRFHGACQFKFFPHPPNGSSRRCSACNHGVEGFVYSCSCGSNLHPCCHALPPEIELDRGQRLDLSTGAAAAACNHCGEMRESWSYMSRCRKYSLHVGCVMEMWRELREDGHLRNWMERAKESWKKKAKKVWKIGSKLLAEELVHVIVGAVLAAALGDPTALFQ